MMINFIQILDCSGVVGLCNLPRSILKSTVLATVQGTLSPKSEFKPESMSPCLQQMEQMQAPNEHYSPSSIIGDSKMLFNKEHRRQ